MIFKISYTVLEDHDLQSYYELVGDNKGKATPVISTDSKEVNDTPLQEDSKKGICSFSYTIQLLYWLYKK